MAAKKKTTRKPGRPTKYNDKIGLEICSRIAAGESLRSVCDSDKLPSKATVLRWILDGKHAEFRDQYTKARQIQAEGLADELMDIADDGSNDYMLRENANGDEYEVENREAINRSRLRVDVRKWYLSKVLPKVYGEKITQEMMGTVNHAHTHEVKDGMSFDAIQERRGKLDERGRLH